MVNQKGFVFDLSEYVVFAFLVIVNLIFIHDFRKIGKTEPRQQQMSCCFYFLHLFASPDISKSILNNQYQATLANINPFYIESTITTWNPNFIRALH